MIFDPSMLFEIGLGISALIAGLVSGWLLRHKKKKTDPSVMSNHLSHIFDVQDEEFLLKNARIHERLVELRLLTNADRAQVALFHNGGKFLDGSAIKRFSISHESCRLGIPSEGINLQNVPLTLLWELVDIVMKNQAEYVVISTLKTEHLRSLKELNNVRGMSILPIRTNNQIIGYIILEWCNHHSIPETNIDVGSSLHEVFTKYRSLIESELQLLRDQEIHEIERAAKKGKD